MSEQVSLSEVIATLEKQLEFIKADMPKFAQGNSSSATRIRGAMMDIIKACKAGREEVLAIDKANQLERKSKAKADVPKKQLK